MNLNAKIIEVQQLFNKKLVKVKKEEVFTKKSFYGTTKIDESKVTDVVTRFDGYITKLNANKNYMFVNKDEVIFSIYSDTLQTIQKEIEISRNISTKALNSSVDKLRYLDINKKEIEKISKNQVGLDGINFYSPSNGIILNKSINENGFVKKGNRLMQVANIDELWFISSVYQEDLEFLKKDLKARVLIDGISISFEANIDFIYPMANDKSKTIDVRFVINNKDKKIFPNMFGKVDIKSTSSVRLTLPKTAVINKASSYYVFKNISQTEFEPVKVEVNRINSNTYEIIEGLSHGDEVINNALFLFDSDAITNMLYETGSDDDW
jgi:Cu(I)/Ag(I) efflux system membrane fusion protein